jgi:hypothetical protein
VADGSGAFCRWPPGWLRAGTCAACDCSTTTHGVPQTVAVPLDRTDRLQLVNAALNELRANGFPAIPSREAVSSLTVAPVDMPSRRLPRAVVRAARVWLDAPDIDAVLASTGIVFPSLRGCVATLAMSRLRTLLRLASFDRYSWCVKQTNLNGLAVSSLCHISPLEWTAIRLHGDSRSTDHDRLRMVWCVGTQCDPASNGGRHAIGILAHWLSQHRSNNATQSAGFSESNDLGDDRRGSPARGRSPMSK